MPVQRSVRCRAPAHAAAHDPLNQPFLACCWEAAQQRRWRSDRRISVGPGRGVACRRQYATVAGAAWNSRGGSDFREVMAMLKPMSSPHSVNAKFSASIEMLSPAKPAEICLGSYEIHTSTGVSASRGTQTPPAGRHSCLRIGGRRAHSCRSLCPVMQQRITISSSGPPLSTYRTITYESRRLVRHLLGAH